MSILRINFNVTVSYQQQTFITADQSAFQRAGTTGQYTITGQPSPLTPVGGQAVASTPQRQLNGQFVDPSATTNQSVTYERQDYVNGYQQQVSVFDYINKASIHLFLFIRADSILTILSYFPYFDSRSKESYEAFATNATHRKTGLLAGRNDGAASVDNSDES